MAYLLSFACLNFCIFLTLALTANPNPGSIKEHEYDTLPNDNQTGRLSVTEGLT
jgi:hypothetical protein